MKIDDSDLEARDEKGRTALLRAVLEPDHERILQLLEAGADATARDNEGKTAIMLAMRYTGQEELYKALVQAGANIDALNKLGETALMMAVREDTGHGFYASELIMAGANLHIRNPKGETAMDLAKRLKKQGVVGVLKRALAEEVLRDLLSEKTADNKMKSLVNHLKNVKGGEGKLATLGELRDLAEEEGASLSEAIPVLGMMLSDKDDRVQCQVVFALQVAWDQGIDITPTIPRLVQFLTNPFKHHVVPLLIKIAKVSKENAALVQAELEEFKVDSSHPSIRAIEKAVEKILNVCKSKVPDRLWKWRKGKKQYSVHTYHGCLTWYSVYDTTLEQSFSDYLANGPSDILTRAYGRDVVPEKVRREIYEMLGAEPPHQKSKKEVRRKIEQAIEELVGEISEEDLSSCEICKNIPERAATWRYLNEEWKDPFPEAVWRLEPFIAVGWEGRPSIGRIESNEYTHLKQCPICGRLYKFSYSYEYGGGGVGPSDEDISIIRIDLQTAKDYVFDAVWGNDMNWWHLKPFLRSRKK